jgi:hypothetical protein
MAGAQERRVLFGGQEVELGGTARIGRKQRSS